MQTFNRILEHNRDLGDNETMIKKRQSALIPRGLWWSCALLRLGERHRGARVLSCCSFQLVTFYTNPWCYPVFWFVMTQQFRQSDSGTVVAELQGVWLWNVSGTETTASWLIQPPGILIWSNQATFFIFCTSLRGKYCTLSAWKHDENSQNIKSVNVQGIPIVRRSAELCLDLRISHRHEKHRCCVCSVVTSSVRPQHLSNYMANANDQSYHSLLC